MARYRPSPGVRADPEWQWVVTLAENHLALSIARVTAMNQLINYLLAVSALTVTLGATVISRRPRLFLRGVHALYYLAGGADLLSLGLLIFALLGFSTVTLAPRPLAIWRQAQLGRPAGWIARRIAEAVERAVQENATQVQAKGLLASYAVLALFASLLVGSAALVSGSGGRW